MDRSVISATIAPGTEAARVSKGNRNRDKRKQQRQSSSLSDHKRAGKLLRPPLMSLPGITPVIWWRDSLPNYLWLCWNVRSEEYVDVFVTSKFLDVIEEGLGEDREGFPEHWVLTGKLTDFEAIPESAREAVLKHLENVGAYNDVIPEDFAIALAMYPDAPGRWLIQPWLDRGIDVDPVAAERELSRVVDKAVDGRGDVATRAKALLFRQMLKAGRIMFSADVLTDELADAFAKYPKSTTDEQNARLESHVRASFLALESLSDDATTWSKSFWRSNWKLYACRTSDAELGPDVVDGRSDEARDSLKALHAQVNAVWDRFARVATTTDPDLYNPDRFEVVTGLVGRGLRLVRTIAGYPLMWTMEQGAPVLRALVESRIVIRFLEARADPDLYSKFKAFGVGRLKLQKLHLEEFLDKEGDNAEGLQDYIDLIAAYVNRDTYEEFVDIDLGGSFSGIDMRKMADEVSLGDDYRLLFAPASSNVHGEWGAIDMNVFESCLNPLHGRHRVIADNDRTVIGPHFLNDLIEYATSIVEEYESFVVTP